MLLQIALQAIVSRHLGAGQAVDAYEGAAAIPLVLSSMITLPLGAVLIPLVTRAQQASGEPAAWESAGTVTLFLLVGTLVVAGALVAGRDAVLDWLYALDPTQRVIAGDVLKTMAWLIPANALIGLSAGLHHWRGRFALPAAAGVIGPALTLGWLASGSGPTTVHRLAEAMLVGTVANAALQFPFLLPKLRWKWSPKVLNAAARLTGPVLLGAIYWRIDPLVDRSIGSRFADDGVLASLGYSSRVTNAMAALASGGLSVVAFPRMSAAAGRSNDDLARETSGAIGASLLILIPLSAAWFLFGGAIIRDLFEGGLFTPADTARVALYVRCAIGVVIGGSVGEILGRTFYAQHNTLTPMLIGTVCVTVGFALKWVFSRFWGPSGLLIASSVAMCASAGIQFLVLRRRLGTTLRTSLWTDGIRSMLATALACLTGWAVLQTRIPYPAFAGGGLGLIVYLVALSMMRSGRVCPLAS